jgi:phage terminase Nu1 subunit (DNA packaging protein)
MMLTPAELAAALRCSERTVARMVLAGCPSMLVGARRRFDLAAVIAWTQEQAAQCPSAKTPPADGTRKFASAVADFTECSRKVQLRVMPSGSRPS